MSSPAAAALLVVRRLTVAYGKVEAVHDVSLAVAPGHDRHASSDRTAPARRRCSARSWGSFRRVARSDCLGTPAATLSVEERVARGLILVPERRELFAAMSVADNLELGAFQRARRGDRDRKSTLAEVYHRFPRLPERRDQLAGTLSGGERQMLAMGRALMGKPKLLMLDEPSLGLAPLIVREIFSIIAALRSTGVSILLVEQNARAALQVADYGYVLESGELAMEGASAMLAANPRVAATYLGRGAAAD